MNICIESQLLNHHQKTGLMTYVEGLINGVSMIDKVNQYYLTYYSLRRGPNDMPGPQGVGNFHKHVLRVPDRKILGRTLLVNNVILPKFFTKKKIDIFHRPSGYHMPRVRNIYKILTVHDLRTITINDPYLKQNIKNYEQTLKNIDLCVTVSECTKRDLMHHFKLDEKRIKVIYLGADDRYRVLESEKIRSVKTKFGITQPYLLSVGSVPRKNLARIIRGFANSKYKNNYKLVLNTHMDVEKYKDICHESGIMDQVLFINSVSNEDLVALFNGCHCFIFPSLYEGFGLPILEAMQCGAPVITSSISACPEVAGDAAIYVDPNNIGEITDAIDQICGNSELRQTLIKKGFEQSKKFSWDYFARDMKAIYTSA